MNFLEKAHVFEKMAEQRLLRVKAQALQTPADPASAMGVGLNPEGLGVEPPISQAPAPTGETKPQAHKPDLAREKQITENIVNQAKTILADLANANMQSLTDVQKQQAETFMKKLYPALVWRRKWLTRGPLQTQDNILLMEEINELIGPNNQGFYNVTNGYKNMGSETPGPMPSEKGSGVGSTTVAASAK